ncbi:MAG: mandelate racemase/muconate lactonizing enzyme family protein [Pseudodesulfovibrio sp.]|uniref:mandelate racemase/muconate lactonizing enzyme family protein n=1 Tax=Pseudodesulfovibrio sp. TaxID=2035812 RepID=UPI003D0E9BCA
MIRIQKIDLYVLRYPIDNPVRTSFGVMHDRPAVLVRVEDGDGAFGWGEIWCNFPTCGAEHRYALCKTVAAPLLFDGEYDSPDQAFEAITRKTHILALQAREPGPLANTAAGVAGALWDLEARRAGMPLYQYMFLGEDGEVPSGFIPGYASGINSAGAVENVKRHKDLGFNRFKVKIGFEFQDDLQVIEDVLSVLDESDTLCVDVNQGWTLEEARKRIRILGRYPLGWIEEPIASDHGPMEFAELNNINDIPIACGENIYGLDEFRQYARIHALGVIQPDACKWGGPGMCLAVARATLDAGLIYCPHFLGAGIGLWTSAHILAAAGGPGQLEVDINHNPLQNMLGSPAPALENGGYQLPGKPGIGVDPDLDAAAGYILQHETLER